jgi:hypothetical protein
VPASRSKSKGLTAIVDADVLIYQAALQVEHEHRWDDGIWTYHANEKDGEHALRFAIDAIVETVGGTDFVLPLTDLDRNWRLDVLPTYKGNRKGTRRPLLRRHLWDWVQREYANKAYMRPGLEGDDVFGILMTHPTLIPGEKIGVSIDKDMKTIPGRHYNQGKGIFFDINEEEADWWHMHQTITGDTTDGYSGCPGAGPDAADEMCNEPHILVPYEHALRSGPRKGTFETRYRKEPTDDLWSGVVSLYASKGLSEEVALTQARVARICRHTDYDYNKRKVKLWHPTR